MPIRHQFFRNGVLIWNWGVITGEEVIPANREIYEHQFDAPFEFQLCDMSEVTDMLLTSDDIRTIAEDDARNTINQAQVSIIVAPTDFVYGMCRMWGFQAETETFATYVVRTKKEAFEILSKNNIHLAQAVLDEFMRDPTNW